MNTATLVLASTSAYRKSLLSRLQLPFVTASPNVDESMLPGETARETSLRLSVLKAQAIAPAYPDALIIGSDQVALLNGKQLGKPGTHSKAVLQLKAMQGNTLTFYTALSLLNTRTNELQTAVAENRVSFRTLSDDTIERYLEKERPYDCAGSAKAEGLGITLIRKIEGDDPNALIGLPLILLTDMLLSQGVHLP